MSDVCRYFNSLLADPIGDNEMINVGVPKFITQVAELLKTVDKRTLANYMVRIIFKGMIGDVFKSSVL